MEKRAFLLMLSFLAMCACTQEEPEKAIGYLTVNIGQATGLKADIELTDFILRISNGNAELIRERIGDLPPQIALPVGLYTIEAYSGEFSEPKFEKPFYSGKTTVDIEAGETHEATLVCSLGNAGVKLVWSSEFSTLFSTYYAQINHEHGFLHYSSVETRTGYFLPGTAHVTIFADGKTIQGGAILLSAKDMVTTTLRTKESPSGNLTIGISIDQTVNEREIEVWVDPQLEEDTNSETNPYTVAEAIARQGENAKWITGYIAGSKPSSGYDFANREGWQVTNIVLADNIDETNDRNVIFVELAAGTYRTGLNIIDHPNHLHRKVLIRGNLTAYQSRSGLRNLTGFIFP